MRNHYAYAVITDTKSRFSKVARNLTKSDYNHASFAFTDDLSIMYTYTISGGSQGKGGFEVETYETMKGSDYMLYRVKLTSQQYLKLNSFILQNHLQIDKTNYNRLNLLNSILGKPLFKSKNNMNYICSEFVAVMFEMAGVDVSNGRGVDKMKPHEFLEQGVLEFVRQGKIT